MAIHSYHLSKIPHWWIVIPTLRPNNKSHCIWLFLNSSIDTSKWDKTHTSSQVLLPECAKTQFAVVTSWFSHPTVNVTWFNTCFHTSRVSGHFNRSSLWHSSRISHRLEVWLAIVTPSMLITAVTGQLSSFWSMLPQSIDLINCISFYFLGSWQKL